MLGRAEGLQHKNTNTSATGGVAYQSLALGLPTLQHGNSWRRKLGGLVASRRLIGSIDLK
ncbi:MAG TPA: hypothetical protein DEF45_12000 [Rhodopirellula sp.]|nr:hypothetical protein [Rhodopirellula sp.]